MSHHIIVSCYNCYKITWQKAGCVCPCPSLENIVMEDVMLVMFCSAHIGGLGQLHAQIWMTAKMQNFNTSSVKVHWEKSGTFSQKVSAKCNCSASADLEILDLDLLHWTLFCCLQLCKKYTKEVTFWVTLYIYMYVRCPHFPTHVWEWELDRKVWHAAEIGASQGPENVL